MKRSHVRHAEGGFTLIEVLIAFLLLAVGVLGLAGTQLSSLKYNQTSSVRTQASFLAYSIADAMRANKSNAASYALAEGSPKPTATPSNTAETDMQFWRQSLTDQLPEGDGSISINGNIVTITVLWYERRVDNGSNPDDVKKKFVVKTQL